MFQVWSLTLASSSFESERETKRPPASSLSLSPWKPEVITWMNEWMSGRVLFFSVYEGARGIKTEWERIVLNIYIWYFIYKYNIYIVLSQRITLGLTRRRLTLSWRSRATPWPGSRRGSKVTTPDWEEKRIKAGERTCRRWCHQRENHGSCSHRSKFSFWFVLIFSCLTFLSLFSLRTASSPTRSGRNCHRWPVA